MGLLYQCKSLDFTVFRGAIRWHETEHVCSFVFDVPFVFVRRATCIDRRGVDQDVHVSICGFSTSDNVALRFDVVMFLCLWYM